MGLDVSWLAWGRKLLYGAVPRVSLYLYNAIICISYLFSHSVWIGKVGGSHDLACAHVRCPTMPMKYTHIF